MRDNHPCLTFQLNTRFKLKCNTASSMAADNPIVHCSTNLALTA